MTDVYESMTDHACEKSRALCFDLAEFAAGTGATFQQPLWVLAGLRESVRYMESATRAWVAQAREAGLSWSDIGDALGVSKQAAAKKYGGSGV